MRQASPERLTERQIGQLLLKIYWVNGWPVPEQQEAKESGRVPQPASTRDTTANARRQT